MLKENKSTENLFTPTFGKMPLYLAGRNEIINEIMNALDGNGSDPNLSAIFVGARGTGKTTLLTYITNKALEYGWISVNLVCSDKMLDGITARVRKVAQEHLEKDSKIHIKGVSVGQFFSVQWENAKKKSDVPWDMEVSDILSVLTENNIGVIFTVDEVKANVKEMNEFANAFQMFVRENKKVSLLMAGLPYQVSQLLQDEYSTFLRRAQYKRLERIPDGDAANAFERTVLSSGRKITPDALKLAVKEADGFPYLIQLVGYKMCQQNPKKEEISADDVALGAKEAKRNMADSIYRTTLRELSDGDIKYLLAMCQDEDESLSVDLMKRLDKSRDYVAQYRKRLLESGVIRSDRRGVVAFDIPGFKEFLKDEYDL